MNLYKNPLQPLVSIIVPIYNVEIFLKKCILSLINQTYKNIEIFLINDGSTDNSGSICDEFAQKDTRIKVFHNINMGVSMARNCGLKKSKGEYILFVDPDDYIEYNLIETCIKNSIQTNSDIVIFGLFKEKKNNIRVKKINIKDKTISKRDALYLLWKDKEIKYLLCNKFYKAHIISPLFPLNQVYEDIYVMPMWFNNANKISIIQDCLYHYVIHKNSITNTPSAKNMVQYLQSFVHSYIYFADEINLFNGNKKPINRVCRKVIFSNAIKIVKTSTKFDEIQPYLIQLQQLYLSLYQRHDFHIPIIYRPLSKLLLTSIYSYYIVLKYISFIIYPKLLFKTNKK